MTGEFKGISALARRSPCASSARTDETRRTQLRLRSHRAWLPTLTFQPATRETAQMRPRAPESDGRLGDALIDLYVEWREECSAVHAAYERWRQASRDDRAAAFLAYSAALDREERAGNVYAAMVRRLSRAPQPA